MRTRLLHTLTVALALASVVVSAETDVNILSGLMSLDPQRCAFDHESCLTANGDNLTHGNDNDSHNLDNNNNNDNNPVELKKPKIDPCEIALERLMSGRYGKHSIAMLDAMGKSYNDAGKWDECRSLPEEAKAKYCLLKAHEAHFGQDGYLGLCVPSICTDLELSAGGNIVVKEAKKRLGISDSLQFEVDCSEGNTELDGKAVVCLVLLFLLVAMCVLATVVDLIEQRLARVAKRKSWSAVSVNGNSDAGYQRLLEEGQGVAASGSAPSSSSNAAAGSSSTSSSNQSDVPHAVAASGADAARAQPPAAPQLPMWYRFLRCFRVNHNLHRLVSPSPVDNLTALNGLRVIAIAGIILGHTHLYMLNAGLQNPAYVIFRVMSRWSIVFISGCELFVDVFFFLSGFLVAYGTLKELNRKGRVNWLFFYIHRYLRLTPALAFVLFVYVALSPYAGEGPLWTRYQRTLGFPNLTTENCHKYWWGNLLYINNFYPREFEQQCMKWSWFLADDFQFYLLSPIFLIAYHKCKKLGWVLCVGTIAFCLLLRLILVEAYDITLDQGKTENYVNVIYGKPYARMPAYLVGFATAFLYNQCGRKYRIHPVTLVLGSIAAGTTLIACWYGKKAYFENPPSFHWDKTRNDLFLIFSRFATAVATAWFMFISFIGEGGMVRSLLGAHFWTPIARLTYSAYLIHPALISVSYYSMRQFIRYESLQSIYLTIGNVIMAYGLALVIFLIIEKPSMTAEMLLFTRKKK